ncbi:DUF6138 family protein [Paenibacillus sp. MER 99-2]|uniref:DUF6138 family protein n=1 Tax=Paenibacillus sp. MER 99-2 TaxID=2939572 RepID=UPI00333F56B4
MTTTISEAVEEMVAEIHEWFDEQAKRTDLDSIVQRTTLQVGIFNDILLDYKPGRTTIDSADLDLDDSFTSKNAGFFTPEEVRSVIQPQLVEVVKGKLEQWVHTPMIDYHFTFRGKFPTTEGKLHLTLLDYLHEEKRQQLLERVHSYVVNKVENGTYPTKPLESFFLTRHLLDVNLFPELDVARTIAIYNRIQELNKSRPEALAEHRMNMIHALTDWAENQFLPKYYDIQTSTYRANEYTLKPGAVLEQQETRQLDENENLEQLSQPIDLLLYGAVMILRYEPSYSKPRGLTFMELAVQLGSKRAVHMMDEGSGTFDKEEIFVKNKQVEGKANDVYSLITIHIRQEEASAYEQALTFIIHLLKRGFPKHYKIKLKSSDKQYLPIKGLAKSDTHRFFANALQYAGLHSLLEQYARVAIEQFEFYADTEGEKNCMTGSYATFGLGLTDEQCFPLVAYYMNHVDDEHQLVQDKFITAFAEKYGVTTHSAPILVDCLRRATDSLKLKILPDLESEDKLALLVQQMNGLKPYEVEHVLYPIWGKVEKLATLARKADGRRKELLLELLQAAGK